MSIHWRMVWLSALLIGCGQTGTAPTTADNGSAAIEENTGGSGMTIVAGVQTESAGAATESEPEPGTPLWLLQEIQRIRLTPLPGLAGNDSDETESGAVTQTNAAAPSPEALQEQLARNRAIRRERNEQIVKLATEAIALTAKDAQLEQEFLAAVAQLLDARLQLALQGDEESIGALYDIAEAFHLKKPDSPAAAAAQFSLVSLAHAHAMRYGQSEPKWLQEFARQAQLYATRFPDEQQRSLPLLMAAGKTCELNGMLDEAKACYSLIPAKFPDSPQAIPCDSIVRRLNLVGKPLQFAGPTLDGNFVNVNDYPGKAVVIVFWASHVKPFQEQVATLQTVGEKYKKYAQVLSVSLDSEEPEVDAFLERTKLTWPVIFHVEPEKRGWNAPLASYYGLSVLPAIWIVDPKGQVADTQVTAETLEEKLREILLRHLNKTANSTDKATSGTRKPTDQ